MTKEKAKLPKAPEYSSWGHGEEFLKNLIAELKLERKGA